MEDAMERPSSSKTKVGVLLGLLLLHAVTEQQKLPEPTLPAVLALLDDLLQAQREGLVVIDEGPRGLTFDALMAFSTSDAFALSLV